MACIELFWHNLSGIYSFILKDQSEFVFSYMRTSKVYLLVKNYARTNEKL